MKNKVDSSLHEHRIKNEGIIRTKWTRNEHAIRKALDKTSPIMSR
jgi:hypothetical protein